MLQYIVAFSFFALFMVLIKNGLIVDGTGVPPYRADVLIKRDRISAIGSFSTKSAHTVIDAMGAYVAPGFIDINNDSDHYGTIFSDSSQSSFLKQGVTTIVGGMCGGSLAPLIDGSLISMRKWMSSQIVNVNWHTVGEFFDVLQVNGIGVNFATLVGHSTVRRAITRGEQRDLTREEIDSFKNILSRAMSQGAFGFSTGLGYSHAKMTPYGELKELVAVTAKNNGLYTTHLRSETNELEESVKETIQITRDTGARTLISHFRPILGFEQEYEAGISLIEGAGATLPIYFDLYPFPFSLYPIYRLLPLSAQTGKLEDMLTAISSPHIKDELVENFPYLDGGSLIVAYAPSAPYLVHKKLGEIAKNHGVSCAEALVFLMKETKMKAVVLYRDINIDFAIHRLRHSQSIIVSNSPSVTDHGFLEHDRLSRTFPYFLEIVANMKLVPIEDAIKKITYTPASLLGIDNRGVLKPTYFADIAVFKDSEIRHVLVNGRVEVSKGDLVGSGRSGMVLRKTK